MTGPANAPAFCAHCVEVRSDLTRCLRRGRTVWLCPECIEPAGALRIHDPIDRQASATPGASIVGTDGNSRRGRGGR